MENHKVCPFAAANPQIDNSKCLGEGCACYVKMQKPCVMQIDQCEMADSEFFSRYEGCGLVAHVPWEMVIRKKNSTTTETKPVN